MSDIDEKILNALSEASLSTEELADKLQRLQDEAVKEATAELEEDLATRTNTVKILTGVVSNLRQSEDLLKKSHIKQTSFARSTSEYLLSVSRSKNPLIRLLARACRWGNVIGDYERFKYEATTEALAEMNRQDVKWGTARQHPNGTGPAHGYTSGLANMMKETTAEAFQHGTGTWSHILMEEVYEAMAEDNPRKLKVELIQVAAVCLAWVVSLKMQRRGR